MKKIYILLTKSSTPLSKAVGFVTSDRYTHVSIAFDAGLQPLYSSSRKNGETLFPAGPCTENLQRGYLKRHPQIPCALYELTVCDEAYLAAKAEAEWIIAHADNYGFNLIGLMLCGLNISHRSKRNYFCSQLVGEILQKSRALELPKDASLMRPSDYMEFPELVCCFAGNLQELTKLQQNIHRSADVAAER